MIRTRICDLLDIPHPIVLGGMGNATTAPLVAAVSNAGGFGTLGTSALTLRASSVKSLQSVSARRSPSASTICCFKSRKACLQKHSPPSRRLLLSHGRGGNRI
jgi:hypothetical protein